MTNSLIEVINLYVFLLLLYEIYESQLLVEGEDDSSIITLARGLEMILAVLKDRQHVRLFSFQLQKPWRLRRPKLDHQNETPRQSGRFQR